MSAGFGSDLSVDIKALVGEMPDTPCESPNHNNPVHSEIHDDGPATHYFMMMHECRWRGKGDIYAGCAALAARIGGLPGRIKWINCLDCGVQSIPREGWVRLVGPIAGGGA